MSGSHRFALNTPVKVGGVCAVILHHIPPLPWEPAQEPLYRLRWTCNGRPAFTVVRERELEPMQAST